MFPYKIRKPAYGGSLNGKATKDAVADERKPGTKPSRELYRRGADADRDDVGTSALVDKELQPLFNCDDPHAFGGNLQRAILLDLIELREVYLTSEFDVSSVKSGYYPTRKNWTVAETTSQRNLGHSAVGSSFRRF